MMKISFYNNEDMIILGDCTLCPRECHANRLKGGSGYCGIGSGLNIASICIHRGEEPAVCGPDGICNIFFSGCNLKCKFCQNHEISRSGKTTANREMTLEKVLDQIEEILLKGINSVGFVSPSHVIPQVKAIIRGLNQRGIKPVTVYNTSGYDKPETLRNISELIDVFLPDYKYCTPETALEFSDAYDYPVVAIKALKEMYYQKGSTLRVDDNGMAENGLIIRHLVLPGHMQESKKVLMSVAEELSTGVHLSLMSQYYPTEYVKDHPQLNRSLYKEEYYEIVEFMESLGFRNGWVQEMESYKSYRPDFSGDNPFDK